MSRVSQDLPTGVFWWFLCGGSRRRSTGGASVRSRLKDFLALLKDTKRI